MGKHGNTCATRLTALLALLCVLAGTALAGEAFMKALKLLRDGDPEGIALMEEVCRNTAASDAFLPLSDGYLKINKDPKMAMDAAVRGLEGYDENWGYNVPKKDLYHAFLRAAAQAKKEDLIPYVGRIEKLGDRDGDLTDLVMKKYGKYSPLKHARALLLSARKAEKQKQLGAALVRYDKAVAFVDTYDLADEFEEQLSHAAALGQQADDEYEKAVSLIEAERYREGLRELKRQAQAYRGHEKGRRAAAKFDEILASDEVKDAIAEARAEARELEAAEALAEAREFRDDGRLLDALSAYRRAVRYSDTAAAEEAAPELEALEQDPKLAELVEEAETARACQGLLSIARSYLAGDMKPEARQVLDQIITTYPGTKWAEEARQLKTGM